MAAVYSRGRCRGWCHCAPEYPTRVSAGSAATASAMPSIFLLISERYLESQSYIAPVFADRV
ncbi:hypothetical protein N8634_00510 [bacterium]|jgi:hypothetical protein|nr:hypothetical protein [bacterium]